MFGTENSLEANNWAEKRQEAIAKANRLRAERSGVVTRPELKTLPAHMRHTFLEYRTTVSGSLVFS